MTMMNTIKKSEAAKYKPSDAPPNYQQPLTARGNSEIGTSIVERSQMESLRMSHDVRT